jgi:molybdopterin-guanine dinucleotide biosynthesis protein A
MGRDKAALTHPQAGTFLDHVVSVARQVVPDVYLLGSSAAIPSSAKPLPTLADAEAGQGPLAGLCSALDAASPRWVLLLACDLPLLGARVLERLLSHRSADVDAVAFTRESAPATLHACCALYHPRILSVARRELIVGKASLQSVLRSVRLTTLRPDVEDSRQLRNVNTPEDLARFSNSFRYSLHGQRPDWHDVACEPDARRVISIAEAGNG